MHVCIALGHESYYKGFMYLSVCFRVCVFDLEKTVQIFYIAIGFLVCMSVCLLENIVFSKHVDLLYTAIGGWLKRQSN